MIAALFVALPATAATPVVKATVGPGSRSRSRRSRSRPGGRRSSSPTSRTSTTSGLTGPGVNVATSVPAVGVKKLTVTLKKGTYRFLCDPHPTSMKGSSRSLASARSARRSRALAGRRSFLSAAARRRGARCGCGPRWGRGGDGRATRILAEDGRDDPVASRSDSPRRSTIDRPARRRCRRARALVRRRVDRSFARAAALHRGRLRGRRLPDRDVAAAVARERLPSPAPQRSRSVIPASRAIRSSSAGHVRNGTETRSARPSTNWTWWETRRCVATSYSSRPRPPRSTWKGWTVSPGRQPSGGRAPSPRRRRSRPGRDAAAFRKHATCASWLVRFMIVLKTRYATENVSSTRRRCDVADLQDALAAGLRAQVLDHRAREVDAVHLDAAGRERQRDPSGADASSSARPPRASSSSRSTAGSIAAAENIASSGSSYVAATRSSKKPSSCRSRIVQRPRARMPQTGRRDGGARLKPRPHRNRTRTSGAWL